MLCVSCRGLHQAQLLHEAKAMTPDSDLHVGEQVLVVHIIDAS